MSDYTPRQGFDVPAYEKYGAAIYEASFATIRSEADLSAFDEMTSRVVVRMIHACGQVDLSQDVRASDGFGDVARKALSAGGAILCDAHMVAEGVTRARLPHDNRVVTTLRDERVRPLASDMGTTRSAAAVDLWAPDLDGSVVAIGNAPTALFRLLELLRDGAPAPAAIIGVPVGFIGAAESKEALESAAHVWGIPYLTVRGRRGGSAMASAAVNAVACRDEIHRSAR